MDDNEFIFKIKSPDAYFKCSPNYFYKANFGDELENDAHSIFQHEDSETDPNSNNQTFEEDSNKTKFLNVTAANNNNDHDFIHNFINKAGVHRNTNPNIICDSNNQQNIICKDNDILNNSSTIIKYLRNIILNKKFEDFYQYISIHFPQVIINNKT